MSFLIGGEDHAPRQARQLDLPDMESYTVEEVSHLKPQARGCILRKDDTKCMRWQIFYDPGRSPYSTSLAWKLFSRREIVLYGVSSGLGQSMSVAQANCARTFFHRTVLTSLICDDCFRLIEHCSVAKRR